MFTQESRCAVTAFALGTSQYSQALNCDHPIIAVFNISVDRNTLSAYDVEFVL